MVGPDLTIYRDRTDIYIVYSSFVKVLLIFLKYVTTSLQYCIFKVNKKFNEAPITRINSRLTTDIRVLLSQVNHYCSSEPFAVLVYLEPITETCMA